MIQGWLAGLRRRRVLRVAGAYVVVGWGVLQAVEAAAPVLGLPSWTIALVALLLLVGLPVSMVIAWAHQGAPAGVAAEAADARRGRWLDAGLLLAASLVVVLGVWQVAGRDAATPDAAAS